MSDRDLFIAALEQPEAERQAWLDQACADDPDLRRRLDVLLRAHELASQFLASPAVEHLAPPNAPTRDADPAKEGHDDTADVLALLAPAEKPGQLGKLKQYEVLEVVGKGAMGVVVKAFDPKLHRVVAIKLMARHLAANPPARRRFEREAKAVAAVRDEHVVAVHDVETDGPLPYLVMEFIGGVSLQDRLDKRGPLEVKEILRIGMQAAQGLAAAHAQGLVHRDVKPANILLENGVERVKLTDFGLARAVDDVHLTQSGVITGTPNYMSPEQADGRPVDHRSDLFSLGSVLYALATGHPPFRASGMAAVLKRVAADAPRPARDVNPDVPDWLEAIIQKLHAKDPAQRFQSAREVAELLGQHLAHLQQPGQVPMPARVVVPVDPAVEWGVIKFLLMCFLLGNMITGAMLVAELWENPTNPSFWAMAPGILMPLSTLWFWIAARRRASTSSEEANRREAPPKSPATRRDRWGLAVWWLAYSILPAGACAFGLLDYLLDLDLRRMDAYSPPVFARASLVLLAAWFAVGVWLSWLRQRRRRSAPARRPLVRRIAVLVTLGVATLGLVAALALALILVFAWSTPRTDFKPTQPIQDGYLRVVKDDRDAEVLVTCNGERVIQSSPGGRSTNGRQLPADALVDLSIRKGAGEVHQERFRLRPGETREIHIPPLVLPERTVRLVPKRGSFPADVTRMRIAPDRTTVAVERFDGPIIVFDADTGKERFTVARPKSDCTAFGFTPDGKQLAYLTPADDGESVLRVVDAQDGKGGGKDLKPKRSYFSNAHALAFSPDGKRLAVSSAYNQPDGTTFRSRLHRWEWPSGKELPMPEETQDGVIEAAGFTSNGNEELAASGRKESAAWKWDPGAGENPRRSSWEDFAHDALAVSPGACAIAGWSEATGKPAVTFWQPVSGFFDTKTLGRIRFGSLALSPDRVRIAAGTLRPSLAAMYSARPFPRPRPDCRRDERRCERLLGTARQHPVVGDGRRRGDCRPPGAHRLDSRPRLHARRQAPPLREQGRHPALVGPAVAPVTAGRRWPTSPPAPAAGSSAAARSARPAPGRRAGARGAAP